MDPRVPDTTSDKLRLKLTWHMFWREKIKIGSDPQKKQRAQKGELMI
jgi:hypothetical protein